MEYFERLQKIAPIAKEPVKAAYRMHFTVSGANYHLFAAEVKDREFGERRRINLLSMLSIPIRMPTGSSTNYT